MTAAELRAAADRLDELAGAATPGPWRTFEQHGRDYTDEGWSEIGVQNDGHTVAITYPTGFENDYPEADAAYIAAMHPEVGKALAAWLRDIDERHAPDPYKVELVLHYDSDEECETCEDGGHESTVCAGCFPTWEGMDGRAVWPCREWKAAENVARLINGGSDV